MAIGQIMQVAFFTSMTVLAMVGLCLLFLALAFSA